MDIDVSNTQGAQEISASFDPVAVWDRQGFRLAPRPSAATANVQVARELSNWRRDRLTMRRQAYVAAESSRQERLQVLQQRFERRLRLLWEELGIQG